MKKPVLCMCSSNYDIGKDFPYWFYLLKNTACCTHSLIPLEKLWCDFCFREIRSNDVRNWSTDKTEVTFMPNRTYTFDAETSCANCSDSDSFTTVNIPLLVSVIILLRLDEYLWTRCHIWAITRASNGTWCHYWLGTPWTWTFNLRTKMEKKNVCIFRLFRTWKPKL